MNKELKKYMDSPILTVRFWYQNFQSAHIVADKLKSYSPEIIPYNGEKHPYKTCAGRIVFVFTHATMIDFSNIIPVCMDQCSFAEILVGDEWYRLQFPFSF